ncbi:hypothetical protein Taro_005041 [Colocasia esculenta]|uniref:Uncharacterized protein n=1 Tax=Colocasia esculenta TaxID=4460 RepID=A0A843TWS2_COLES|nr:hypothetical protein [Colocasia esculenta]
MWLELEVQWMRYKFWSRESCVQSLRNSSGFHYLRYSPLMDTTTPSSASLSLHEGNYNTLDPHQVFLHNRREHNTLDPHHVFLHTRREQAQDKNKQENKPLDQALARQDLKLLALRANNLNKALSHNYTGSLRISITAQRAKS